MKKQIFTVFTAVLLVAFFGAIPSAIPQAAKPVLPVQGKLGWTELKAAMVSSVLISGNILLIVYTAFVFSYAISVAGVAPSAERSCAISKLACPANTDGASATLRHLRMVRLSGCTPGAEL